MTSTARARGFCFTLNNYTEEDVALVQTWSVAYLIFGKEVGESGTPHLQGYVYFANAKTLASLKKLHGRAHWEIARGSPEQASVYCQKDGDFVEMGTKPKSQSDKGAGERERWQAAYDAVAEGRLDDLDADIKCRHLKSIQYAVQQTAVAKRKRVTIDGDLEHVWFVGPPGSGKSRAAREQHPGAFIKDPTTTWWDGYLNEEVVIIDDFDKFQVKQGGDMKRWLDRYPFQAPIKGGYALIRPRKMVITSNYTPAEIWDDPVTVAAIMRRVTLIYFDDRIIEEIDEPGPAWSEDQTHDPPSPPMRQCGGSRYLV